MGLVDVLPGPMRERAVVMMTESVSGTAMVAVAAPMGVECLVTRLLVDRCGALPIVSNVAFQCLSFRYGY